MERTEELEIMRRAYAKQITGAVGVTDTRLQAAFAAVRREDFLGPGPWQILRLARFFRPTPDGDPVFLYTDDLVGIAPERQILSGQPSLHAALLAAVSPQVGEHVVHIGASVGYFTAVMAHLVGPSGRVTAIEYEADLAGLAKKNLETCANVEVIAGDGLQVPFATADVIYVNAGATRPVEAWLDRLSEGGRLLLPLTAEESFSTAKLTTDIGALMRRGAIFRIHRNGETYSARWISPIAIFPCAGARDAAESRALGAALEKGEMHRVTRLYRHDDVSDEDCWLRGHGWCLAYR
jgi:protein-L-isoaspartate(D-aspartate) O-methyltransferase